MNEFDDIPFEEVTNESSSNEEDIFNASSSFEDIPFISNEPPIEEKKVEVPTMMDENNIIVVDERVKNIPKTEEKLNEPTMDDNGILIFDPRIKDVKPKNAKISFKKPTILLPVIAFLFVSILGMYLFVVNSKADTTNLIRIEENGKFGYIDTDGTVITRCKYIYGTDYYKGHAIVKNDNNLYGVLNGRGALEKQFGDFYFIGLYGDKYIASKYTKNGLKQALLSSDLDEITRFKYDSISYAKDNLYLFTRDTTMGILNSDGKEIYTFEVEEIDDKNIDIEISKVNDKSDMYAAIKVNDSSAIINTSTGKLVYGYSLEDINVLKNNVFYIKSETPEENSTYLVIKNDKIKFKSDKYVRVRVDDISSNIAIAIDNEANVNYINLNDGKVINTTTNNDYYYGDGLILEKTHDFNTDKDVYNIISSERVEGSFENYEPVTGEFKNDLLVVKTSNNKYNYVNKKGKLINNNSYDNASTFNDYGYSIVQNNNLYGILDNKGKEIVKLSYNNIEFLDDSLFKLLRDDYKKELFVYQDENKNYGLIDNNNKVIVKSIYNSLESISFDKPIIKVTYDGDDLLYNLANNKELPIKIDTDEIIVKSNYIIIGKNYYNYSGKIIYSVK